MAKYTEKVKTVTISRALLIESLRKQGSFYLDIYIDVDNTHEDVDPHIKSSFLNKSIEIDTLVSEIRKTNNIVIDDNGIWI